MLSLEASSLLLLILAMALTAVSGVPLLASRVPAAAGQKFAAALMAAAGLTGMTGAAGVLITGTSVVYVISWSLPFGSFEAGCDPLSAAFLIPVYLISGCTALYALGYWPASEHPGTVRRLTFCHGLIAASMAALLMARNSVLFLTVWEVMALTTFFAFTADHHMTEVREAGLLYLITTHVASLALFAHFALLKSHTSSFTFPGGGDLAGSTGIAAALFLTALAGFGLKAGLMPLHVWLPSAHAAAPSHISALMSGVMIKTGIYGILRIISFFNAPPAWWGMLLLVLGAVSAVGGVIFAISQHDLKRLLAYHSIENIGIIALGIGTALLGKNSGNPALICLGMGGALLHVINHAIFKGLLFLGAGSVIHASGTREIDRMGGLAKQLPLTSICFIIGAAAICGLPPLNGFVSELLVYMGLFNGAAVSRGDTSGTALFVLAIPALALVGALAAACFVKVYGIVFLGLPRHSTASGPQESSMSMLLPMGILALFCLAIGIFPHGAVSLLGSATAIWLPAGTQTLPIILASAPLGWITVMGVILILLGVLVAGIALKRRRFGAAAAGTWDCGYLRPTPRMQYTASSFAENIVGLFSGILKPEHHEPGVSGPFPKPARFSSHVLETVLDRIYLPLLKQADQRLAPLRKIQHGQIPLYILYIFLTVIVLLILAP